VTRPGLVSLLPVHRFNRQGDGVVAVVGLNLQIHVTPLFHLVRTYWTRSEAQTSCLPCHVEDGPVWTSARGLKEFPGSAVDEEDLAFVIDDGRRGGKGLRRVLWASGMISSSLGFLTSLLLLPDQL